jgi:hypothetical protein
MGYFHDELPLMSADLQLWALREIMAALLTL